MCYFNQLVCTVLFAVVVSGYRGADNRLVSGYGEHHGHHARRLPDIEYHYPDDHTSNLVSARGHHVTPTVRHELPPASNPGLRRGAPGFTSHVSHIRPGGFHPRQPPPGTTTGLIRTTQWGAARVPYRGAVVNVYPAAGRQKTYRGMVTTTVLSADAARHNMPPSFSLLDDLGRSAVQDEPSVEPCYKCPTDRTVVASKAAKFVLMEKPVLKPCHYKSRSAEVRLELLSGVRAGSVLHEGTHTILSRMVYRQQTLQTCQFRYTVIVRKCAPLTPTDHLQINCTASNVWGSECRLSCSSGYQTLGPTSTVCGDQLSWTQTLPHCIAVSGCSLPTSPENGRLGCTMSENDLSDLIPEGTTCQYGCNPGFSIPDAQSALATIACGDGEWNSTVDVTCQAVAYGNTIPDPRVHRQRHRKHRLSRVGSADPCRPSPCGTGDRCMPGPYPALALCSCPASAATADGRTCHNVFLIERLIPGKEGHEKKKKKAAMLLGQVYEKAPSMKGTEISA